MPLGQIKQKETRVLHTVRVNSRRLAYREVGSGPAVLLLHGWPTSSFLWRHVMLVIARERRVLALDLPGFGASDKPTDVTYSLPFLHRRRSWLPRRARDRSGRPRRA